LSPMAQVARREDALRERRRRLDAAVAARLARSSYALASRRAADRLNRALSTRFAAAARGLEHRSQRLTALSPDSVLSRGYSITQDAATGAVLRAATETRTGRGLRIRLAAGRLSAKVETVDP
jgi:exodeoxyribonuclease VII large subunit